MNTSKPLLIVGLGNPGAQYARTRHNVGFMAVNALAGADAVWKKELKSHVAKIPPPVCPRKRGHDTRPQNGGRKTTIIFAKPDTYMNLSGAAVQSLMTFHKIPLENLIVIHDEIDLPLGVVREKTGGGAAGHNGIRSIDSAVGNNYKRIRIGVGRPNGKGEKEKGFLSFLFPVRQQSVSDYVLAKFSDEEMKIVENMIADLDVI
jgi:PTH1 family peptidyl-tRNA hydrolase